MRSRRARGTSIVSRNEYAVVTACSDAVMLRHHANDSGADTAERHRVGPWKNDGSSKFEDKNVGPSIMCKQ